MNISIDGLLILMNIYMRSLKLVNVFICTSKLKNAFYIIELMNVLYVL
jgi:hypothetical protein